MCVYYEHTGSWWEVPKETSGYLWGQFVSGQPEAEYSFQWPKARISQYRVNFTTNKQTNLNKPNSIRQVKWYIPIE